MDWLNESAASGGKTKIHMYSLSGAANVYIADWLTNEAYNELADYEKDEYFPIKPKNGNTLWFRLESDATSVTDQVARGVIYKNIFTRMLTSRDSNTVMVYTVLEAKRDMYNKLIVTVGNRSFIVSADSAAGKSLQLYAKEKIDVVSPLFAKFLTSELQCAWHIMNIYNGVRYKPRFTIVK